MGSRGVPAQNHAPAAGSAGWQLLRAQLSIPDMGRAAVLKWWLLRARAVPCAIPHLFLERQVIYYACSQA